MSAVTGGLPWMKLPSRYVVGVMFVGLSMVFSTVKNAIELEEHRSARVRMPMALITLLALVIRLTWLGGKSLWVDEADSVYFASHTLLDILFHLCDPHPPAYYALLHGFLGLGRSEFWVRLPSAVAGALAVPLLYVLGCDLSDALAVPGSGQRTALGCNLSAGCSLSAIAPVGPQSDGPGRCRHSDGAAIPDGALSALAALLLAVAPLHVWYSQEARMYALVTTLGLCCVCFAVRFFRRGRVGDALGYLLAASVALYTDQASALPLLLANLLWGGLWVHRRRSGTGPGWWELATWAGLQLIAGIAFWLWWSNALFPSLFQAGTFYQLAMVMLVLERFGLSVSLSGIRGAFIVGAVGCSLCALFAVAGVWTCSLVARRRWMGRIGRWVPGLALAVVILFVLGTIGSAVPRLFTVKRLLVSLLPYGLLISAWAMHELQLRRWLVWVFVSFSLVLCGVNILLVPKEPWREVVAAVAQEIGPGDVLWVDELAAPAFDYYYDGSHDWHVLYAARLSDGCLSSAGCRHSE